MKIMVFLFSLLLSSYGLAQHEPPRDVNLTDLDHMMACMQSGDAGRNGTEYRNAMVAAPVDATGGRFYNNIDYANANRLGANSTDYYYDTYVNQAEEGQYTAIRDDAIYVIQRNGNGVTIRVYNMPRGPSPSGDRHYQFSQTYDRICTHEYDAEMGVARELPRPSNTWTNNCNDHEQPLTIRATADRDGNLTFQEPGDPRGNPTVLSGSSWPVGEVGSFYRMLSEEVLRGLERVSAETQGVANINYENAETNPCNGSSACNDAFNCLTRLRENGLLNQQLIDGAQVMFPGFPDAAGSETGPAPVGETGDDET